MAWQKKINARGLAPALLIIALAVIVYCSPVLSALLVYDRQSVLNGELWRLLTAPLVHFSACHLFWNCLVLGAAGFAITVQKYKGFWLVCFLAALLPGIVVHCALPGLERYGGLSGLAAGAAAYFCLSSARAQKEQRVLWVAILMCMAAKIAVESATASPLFVQSGDVPFRVLPLAHMLGFVGAVITIVLTRPAMALRTRVKMHLRLDQQQ